MTTRSLLLILSALSLAACGTSAPGGAPSAPTPPDGWAVVSDIDHTLADLRPVSEKLGVELTALRNTVYLVEGKRVQLNALVTANSDDAERLHAVVLGMKPADFLHRNGLVLYELVCKDDAITEGQQLLASLR